jgi:hypothetical protein
MKVLDARPYDDRVLLPENYLGMRPPPQKSFVAESLTHGTVPNPGDVFSAETSIAQGEYLHLSIYLSIYLCIYLFFLCTCVCACIYIYTHVYVCMCVCACVCVCVCVYVYVYILSHTYMH